MSRRSSSQKNSVLGHRARMRERVLRNGVESLADYEIIEMLLFLSVPRQDTKPRTKELMATFCSIGGVVNAPVTRLREIGLNDKAIKIMRLPQVAASLLAVSEPQTEIVVGAWEELVDYLHDTMEIMPEDSSRVLFLNNKNRLLADEAFNVGRDTQDMFRRALSLHATALICLHSVQFNVQGEARRLRSVAVKLQKETENLAITLHDYIFIDKQFELFSFRQQGIIV